MRKRIEMKRKKSFTVGRKVWREGAVPSDKKGVIFYNVFVLAVRLSHLPIQNSRTGYGADYVLKLLIGNKN
jgi:hypothetical protein